MTLSISIHPAVMLAPFVALVGLLIWWLQNDDV